MSKSLSVAVVQCAMSENRTQNIDTVSKLVRDAAKAGATLILPPELFDYHYFPQQQSEAFFDLAASVDQHPSVTRMRELARELQVEIPASFFERDHHEYYNSVAMIGSDGALLGVYRKSHIPDGPGYQEKFYFKPGDTGMKVWNTRNAHVGVGICWDQWFPECARAMALQGAEILLYPTAIGSEPEEPETDSVYAWRGAMIGHAISNAMPVAAANRVGTEKGINFYGSSFICDQSGKICAELNRSEEGFAMASFDLEAVRRYRANWGFFRDRRPELYGPITDKS